ncbi:alkaline phosphatase [Geminocystis sp. NIES-3708]|uniref:CAP domain-containing protein n=1 Tax=Geminocystis sp. NIES-3708 TaxID=1615909 RepID=UPI0005FCA8D2|nr:CAP domain-containing protein [Geminocystis sp. NIES-3708]BAQ62736.1 alkaline phosphatase [Geminocystis sp. NIES-3708]
MTQREPTAIDQLMLELINRARKNPQQEAERLINGLLNEGVPSQRTISNTPKQPLAFNLYLNQSAKNHSEWILEEDIFSHVGVNNTTSKERMAIAGYQFIEPWGSGENIAWKGTTANLDFTKFTIDNYNNLFVDLNYPNRGHRVAIMKDDFQEIGIASIQGVFTSNKVDYNAVMTTQHFAYSASNSAFLTGVVYSDEIVNDDFYTLGEGIGNINIIAENIDSKEKYETKNWSTGGYSLPLSPGTYNVSFIGNLNQDFQDDIVAKTITIKKQNIKLDIATDDLSFVVEDNSNIDENDLNKPVEKTNDELNIPIDNQIENNIIPIDNSINNQSINKIDSLLNNPIYRFQNQNQLGNYLYTGEQEKTNIQNNFSEFKLEGLAFYVGISANDNLTTIYRFQNSNIPGTYLFVGEEEAKNIRQNFTNFKEEGIAFYVYGADSNKGDSIYRLQNSNILGTYLFVGETEKNNILANYSNFILEGVAFKVEYST